MSRVIAAFAQFLDGSADPLTSGWLEFFETGTNNTHKNTYADVDQTIANANPLQLDGEGRCPNVFGQGLYRVVSYANNPLTNAPGAMVQNFDPVVADYTPQVAGVNFSAWLSTETYQVGSIVLYNSVYFRSIVANNLNNPPDTNLDKWEQIDFLRYWNVDVTYALDDMVIYNGALYFSFFNNNIGNQPDTSPAYWVEVGAGAADLSWKPDVIYSYGDVVESGTWFRSIQNNNIAHDPATSADWWESIDFVRYWNQYVTYGLGDLVLRNSSFYTSLAGSNINHDPETSPTWWLITNVSYVDSVFASVVGGFKNIITNGNFDIWQRGTSSTSIGYLADRWYSRYITSQSKIATGLNNHPNGIRFETTSANFARMEHRIPAENSSPLVGEIVTISFYVRSISGNAALYANLWFPTNTINDFSTVTPITPTFTVWTDNNPVTSWAKYNFSVTLPSGVSKGLSLIITRNNYSSSITEITGVQIEKGSAATEFELRPFGVELALCQRYYEKSYPAGVYPGAIISSYAGVGFSGRAGGTQPIPLSFDVEKRATPTFTGYSPSTGASGYIHRASDATDWLIANMINITTHGIAGINLSAALTAGDMMFFHWTADAEL